MNSKIKRIVAGIIDYYIVCFLASTFTYVLKFGKPNTSLFAIILYLIFVFLFLIIKDFAFKNASIGKRIFNFKIIKKDKTNFTIVDALKRNITIIFLLPIELFLIIVDNIRIGDIWAKTSVIYNDSNISKTKD